MSAAELLTHVARADDGENQFCGFPALSVLTGHSGFWAQVFLAAGAHRPPPEDERLLDDVSTAVLAADPRIWPLKLARLGASYGGTVAGMTAGQLLLEGAFVGPWGAGLAATCFQGVLAELGTRPLSDVGDVLAPRLEAKARFPGFGVPFRTRDERVDGVRALLVKHGRREGHFVQLADAMDTVLAPRRAPLNVGGMCAALLLDLGLTPAQCARVSYVFATTAFLANAVEGAEQAPEVLQRLPMENVRYVGKAPRVSGR